MATPDDQVYSNKGTYRFFVRVDGDQATGGSLPLLVSKMFLIVWCNYV
jgi:hypothetical protein